MKENGEKARKVMIHNNLGWPPISLEMTNNGNNNV